jgi:WD40 repeat protein
MAELPIIVLAFANEQEGRRYLRDLPEELRRLEDILKEAERNGLCRLELLPNASLDQIFDVFTKNRDQVTILHYAGHADSGRLLLESNVAGGAPAYAAGLATFLGQCGGLQLVFLNGCSSRAQVARLLKAGVAAVIATARAIDDGMAREFAVAFYTELASGLPLRAAYEKARGRVLAAHDTVPEAYYGHRDFGTTSESPSPDPTDDHGFPWEFRHGTELVERWSLPDAAGNPEFGLPHPPKRDLPETPFRHLNWFTAEHAEVFFGRGYQVRELYEEVIDPAGPPILLLYGASGVGKSSLLDAGLVPRLEAGGSAVRYRRRDQEKGLLESLRDALQLSGAPTSLEAAWRAEEARLGKPMVVFLDQVEEVFTRPAPAQPRELDEFLTGLVAVLGNRETRPQGKLLLGFRKEWLAELDRRLAEAKLPRTPVFLKPLDRRGIIEAIRGPARPGRLQRQYRLAVEDGLPEVIADNLLADAGSALAPTLQVLLTKMWERARQANPDQPRFDRALYESLKAEGYLLEDVLDAGLQAIGRWNPDVESSGLALDLLAFHTTDLGTAAQHRRAELNGRYARRADALEGLLGQCKDHYLLIEAEPQSGSLTGSTRLAHDLLAPLVQQRFRLSVAPGQRARRLLENRAPEWRDGKTGPVLDGADLATVEDGASGMRVWTADETRLVEASRRRLRKRAYALRAVLALTVGVVLLAAYLWRATDRIANQNLRIANAERLAACSHDAFPERPQQSLILAVEAVRATRDHGEPGVPAAVQALEDALTQIGGHPFTWHNNSIEALAFAPDGRLVTGSDDGRALVWDLKDTAAPTRVLEGHGGKISALAFAPDGRLVTGSDDGRALVWDLKDTAAPTRVLEGHGGKISALAFAPDGRLVTGGGDKTARVWDLKDTAAPTLVLPEHKEWVFALAFAPDGQLVTGSHDGTARVWDLKDTAAPTRVLEGHEGPIFALAFAPDGRLVTGSDDGTARVWDLKDPNPAAPPRVVPPPRVLRGHEGGIRALAFAPDGRLVTGSDDGTARLWDLKDPDPVAPRVVLRGHEGPIFALAFAPDGRLVTRSGDGDKTARLWDLKNPAAQPFVLRRHKGPIFALAFAPDSRLVTGSGDGDKTARLWDLKDPAAPPLVLPEHEGGIRALAFAPDGRLVTGSYDGTAKVWDLKNRSAPPLVLEGHGDRISALAFAPDGRLVTGNGDGTAKVWDLKNRAAPTLVLKGHEGWISALAFAPDGRLVTGGGDKTARVWDLDLNKLIKLAEQIAGRNPSNSEWQQFFGQQKYRRTFPHLPDGTGVADTGVAEVRQARQPTPSGSPPEASTEKPHR